MIHPSDFYNLLKENEINFFTGIPDSLLKSFCAYVTDNTSFENHVISANEGGAIALAAGNYLSTGKIPLVYMQNSGQGNAVNPLMSLTDSDVYSMPMLLLIGWRGKPGVKDEPQHVKQGKITLDLLETLGIPYRVLPDSIEETKGVLNAALNYMHDRNSPFALVAEKGTFEDYSLKNKTETSFELNREDAIKLITSRLSLDDVVVSTTGKTSRELFEYRERLRQGHEKDFLTVGSMGHSSQIALGIALQKQNRQVYCFDGDGASIMHLGSLAIIGQKKPKNFKHIIFNNGSHDSVGGQPTAAFGMDFPAIARACGYNQAWTVESEQDIIEKMDLIKSVEGPVLLEIKVNKGSRKDLGRPTTTPIGNKKDFMGFLED
jgi:phosphonopyruvate decarboxylase|tara:strand:+ start:795 stop:1922 length:1128 start_codon:yes stop_codon:yes gene_type:complete